MKEYGGYLPLELTKGKEYYDSKNIIRLNCGRTAIYTAIKLSNVKKVYIPLYTCKSVSEMLDKKNISYEFYNINEQFLPEFCKEISDDEMLIWTDYYGLMTEEKRETVKNMCKNVLFDNTQAFFSEPVYGKYNAYSCRKFVGVADGAYLIADGIKVDKSIIDSISDGKDKSAESSLYLLGAIENGTNACYAQSLENEDKIEKTGCLEMSDLTQAILKSVDYDNIKDARRHNFDILQKRLGKYNQFDKLVLEKCATEKKVPMVYPLLIQNDNLRKYLVENKIYVPQWWKWVLENNLSNEFEKNISKYLIPLPIDQRYEKMDMEYIADIIERFLTK